MLHRDRKPPKLPPVHRNSSSLAYLSNQSIRPLQTAYTCSLLTNRKALPLKSTRERIPPLPTMESSQRTRIATSKSFESLPIVIRASSQTAYRMADLYPKSSTNVSRVFREDFFLFDPHIASFLTLLGCLKTLPPLV